MRIAVCIPTYKEEDTIRSITRKIDEGLVGVGFYDSLIINCNNLEVDRTKEIFLATETINKKHYIMTNGIGKGRNLLAFFNYALTENVEYALTLDADVNSMSPEWIAKMLSPMFNNSCDYVVPSYSRSIYEGSTTNHFAFPFIYGLLGKYVRQPIGGDFGFNRELMEYIVNQSVSEDILKYGIDIFLTINAIAGGFQVKEVFLGEKQHKPSFHKMFEMSREVIKSGIFVAQNRNVIPESPLYSENSNISVSLTEGIYKHKQEAQRLYAKAKKVLFESKEALYGFLKTEKIVFENNEQSTWEKVLAKIIKNINLFDINNKALLDGVHALFVMRAIAYWNYISEGGLRKEEAEEIIIEQAKNIRNLVVLENYKKEKVEV